MNHRDIVLIKSLYKARDTPLWVEGFKSATEDDCLDQFVDQLVAISSTPDFQIGSEKIPLAIIFKQTITKLMRCSRSLL